MSEQISKHDHVLLSLSMNLQTMALVQLGKVSNPATGEVERDLEAARGTIDILEMLKAKCRTGTPEAVLKLLDQAVMDLQMNYLDELKKERRGEDAAAADAGEEERGDAGEPSEDEARDPDA
jgi:hypothetical protein